MKKLWISILFFPPLQIFMRTEAVSLGLNFDSKQVPSYIFYISNRRPNYSQDNQQRCFKMLSFTIKN